MVSVVCPTMTSNPEKQIRLDEGHVQRGAASQGPKTPKPPITPVGQGSTAKAGRKDK
jgi:hypothetical protein